MLISNIASSELTQAEHDRVRCDLLARVDTPVWFYDFDRYSLVWANEAALGIWSAETTAELAARELKPEMSKAVEERLNQISDDLKRDPTQTFKEVWTFYPKGQPTAVECVFHAGGLEPGRNCTMITGRLVSDIRQDADMIRATDAILHSQTIAALYTMEGNQLFANRALRSAIGPALTSSHFGDNFLEPGKQDAFLKAVNSGRNWRDVVKASTTNGPRWFDINAAPCRDAVSGEPAFHISAIDVSKAKLATELVKIARDEAEQANRAKSDFIANMSHEMRTPMNGVLGLLEVLRVSPLSPEQQELVRIAQESGAALLELIEDVLDISSTELRAVSLETAPFAPSELARAVVEGLSTPASQKGLELRLEICPDLPREAFGDKRRVAQVMRNLIGNAIKYTDSGYIILSAQRSDEALEIAVSDTGVGVPDAQKAMVFERFYQPDGTRRSIGEGVGLGLSIVKDIVGLWGGDLTVEDADAGGARFAFTLPDAFAAGG